LRGAAARIVRIWKPASSADGNVSAAVPAKLLEVNRQILNNHLAVRRPASFVHAPDRLRGAGALRLVPRDERELRIVDGKPSIVRTSTLTSGRDRPREA